MMADRELRSKLIQINLKRVMCNEEISKELVSQIDVTISLGHIERAVDILEQYQCLVCQMDSDISALLNLICNDE